MGAFLSGGTDSSTVTGMLREVTGEAPRTYSIGFDAAGFDEMSYARIAARISERGTVSTTLRRRCRERDPANCRGSRPAFRQFLLSANVLLRETAKDDGVGTLLGGDGGDELFGGNERYAKQYKYSLYSDLPAAVRKGVIEPVDRCFPRSGSRASCGATSLTHRWKCRRVMTTTIWWSDLDQRTIHCGVSGCREPKLACRAARGGVPCRTCAFIDQPHARARFEVHARR